MKGRIKFNFLFAIVLTGFTYVHPAYAGDGHKHNHEMKGGMPHNDPKNEIIASYLKIKKHLANDTLDGVTSEAKKIIHQAGLIEKKHSKHSSHKKDDSSNLIGEIGKQAAHLSHGKIEDVRKQFATLSEIFIKYLEKSGSDKKLFTFYCPMKKKYWLQNDKTVANPFYGKEMSDCGNIVHGMDKKMSKTGEQSHGSHKDSGDGHHDH